MNLGVVTVNLPRIALESEGDMNKFWEIFNERMNIAEDALVIVSNALKRRHQPMLLSLSIRCFWSSSR